MLDVIRSIGSELVKAALCDPDGACISMRRDETMFFTGRAPRIDNLDAAAISSLPAEVKVPEFTACEELALHRFIYTNAVCGAVLQCNRSAAIAVCRDLESKFLEIPLNAGNKQNLKVSVFKDACEFMNSSLDLDSVGAVIIRGDKALVWGCDLQQCMEMLKSLEKVSKCGYEAA